MVTRVWITFLYTPLENALTSFYDRPSWIECASINCLIAKTSACNVAIIHERFDHWCIWQSYLPVVTPHVWHNRDRDVTYISETVAGFSVRTAECSTRSIRRWQPALFPLIASHDACGRRFYRLCGEACCRYSTSCCRQGGWQVLSHAGRASVRRRAFRAPAERARGATDGWHAEEHHAALREGERGRRAGVNQMTIQMTWPISSAKQMLFFTIERRERIRKAIGVLKNLTLSSTIISSMISTHAATIIRNTKIL